MKLFALALVTTLPLQAVSCGTGGGVAPDGGATPDLHDVDLVQRGLSQGPARSGTRARLRWVDGADGSRLPLDTLAQDAQLTTAQGHEVDGAYSELLAQGGHVYLIPAGQDGISETPTTTATYADAACTQRLLHRPVTCGRAPSYGAYFEPVANQPTCGAQLVTAQLSLVSTPSIWIRQAGTQICAGQGQGDAAQEYYRTTPVPLTTFLEGTLGAE